MDPTVLKKIRALKYIDFNFIDFVIFSEGEETLREIVSDIERGKIKRSYDGAITKNNKKYM